MSKQKWIGGVVLTLVESKAVCPYCERKIAFSELDDKWLKSKRTTMRFKCKCARFINITADIKGDFVAYSL